MSQSQTVRTSFKTAGNITGISSDIVALSNTFKGVGPPVAIQGATVNNMYVDTETGIEYKFQNSGVWEPFFDMSTVPVTVPDPLIVSELDVNTIRGNLDDNIDIDMGAAGHLDVIGSGGTNGIALKTSAGGPSNIIMQANGYLEAVSGFKTYNVESSNYVDKSITIDPDLMTMRNSGVASDMGIVNSTGDVNITGTTVNINDGGGTQIASFDNTVDNRLYLNTGGVPDLFVRPQGLTKNQAAPLRIQHEISNQPQIYSVKGLGSFQFVNGADTVTIDPSTRLLEINGVGDANIRTVQPNSDLLLTVDPGGTGQVRVPNNGLDLDNNPIVNVDDINGGTALGRYGTLGVEGGNLSYGISNMAATFNWTQVGGAAVDEYGELGFTLNPADCSVINTGPLSRKINMVSAALMHSAAWSFGGAAVAQIEVGYIPELSPCINANFTLLTTLSLPLAGDFYTAELPANTNVTLPAKSKLCTRLQVTTPSSTTTTAEMTCTINMN